MQIQDTLTFLINEHHQEVTRNVIGQKLNRFEIYAHVQIVSSTFVTKCLALAVESVRWRPTDDSLEERGGRFNGKVGGRRTTVPCFKIAEVTFH